MSILRRFTDFILQSRFQAMGVAFVCSYIPLLGSVGILIAGLVTLRKGALEGLWIVLAATLPYLFKYYSADLTQGDMVFLGLLLNIASNVLVWAFAVLLRRYNNWSIILEYSVLLGIVVIGLVHLFYPDILNWWGIQLTKFIKSALMMNAPQSATSATEQQVAVINIIKFYATGLFVVSVLFNVMLQLILSRWWQAAMFNPGGLRLELRQIRLSHVSSILLMIGFGLTSFGSEMITDMMPVLCAVFAAAGLSFMHCYLATIKNTLVWLIILYLLVIWLFPLSVVFLAFVALFDVWMDLRKRLIRTI
jgi:hypothetical protein